MIDLFLERGVGFHVARALHAFADSRHGGVGGFHVGHLAGGDPIDLAEAVRIERQWVRPGHGAEQVHLALPDFYVDQQAFRVRIRAGFAGTERHVHVPQLRVQRLGVVAQQLPEPGLGVGLADRHLIERPLQFPRVHVPRVAEPDEGNVVRLPHGAEHHLVAGARRRRQGSRDILLVALAVPPGPERVLDHAHHRAVSRRKVDIER